MSSSLTDLLSAALSARAELIAGLHAEQTDAYRVFHGTAVGAPGLTVDRYGAVLLAQTFHRPLSDEQLAELQAFYATALPGLMLVWNDRSAKNSLIANTLPPERQVLAEHPSEFS